MLLRKNVQLTLEADFLVASSEVEGLEVVVVKDFGGPLGRKGRLGLKPVGLNPAKKQEITIKVVINGGDWFHLNQSTVWQRLIHSWAINNEICIPSLLTVGN